MLITKVENSHRVETNSPHQKNFPFQSNKDLNAKCQRSIQCTFWNNKGPPSGKGFVCS